MMTRTVRYTRETTEWADVQVEVDDNATMEDILDAAREKLGKQSPEWTTVDRCWDEYDDSEVLEDDSEPDYCVFCGEALDDSGERTCDCNVVTCAYCGEDVIEGEPCTCPHYQTEDNSEESN